MIHYGGAVHNQSTYEKKLKPEKWNRKYLREQRLKMLPEDKIFVMGETSDKKLKNKDKLIKN